MPDAIPPGPEYRKGDPVKIVEGSFQGFQGTVQRVDGDKNLVYVLLTIFGRVTPVAVENWQLEKL